MKKFMKGCAIAAAILLVAGLVLGIVGSTARGSETISRVVENVTGGRVKISFGGWGNDWGIMVGDNILDSLDDVDYDIGEASSFSSRYEVQKGDVGKYRLEGTVSKLEIEVGGCFFSVEASDDDFFYVEAENVGKFQAYVESETLHIKSTTGGVTAWSELSGGTIILYIPAGYSFREVEADLGAGTMKFPSLKAEKASLEVGAGQIMVEKAEVSELDVSVGAGQIELKDMDVTDLEAEVGMGELIARGAVSGNIDAKCSMGNLELFLVGKKEDFNYELSGAMGSLNLAGESYGGFSQERDIDNGAGKTMEIDCSMGNVTIGFQTLE